MKLKYFSTGLFLSFLKYSKDKGFIDNYGVENAEALSSEDNSFDIFYPRKHTSMTETMFGHVYEMLRVAAKA